MPDGRWRGVVVQAAQAGPARGGVLRRRRFVQDRLLCRAQLRRRVHAAAGAVRDQQRLGDLGAALGADRRRNAGAEGPGRRAALPAGRRQRPGRRARRDAPRHRTRAQGRRRQRDRIHDLPPARPHNRRRRPSLPRRRRGQGRLDARTDAAPAQVPDRAEALGRGAGKGLDRGMRPPGRHRDQRLPRAAGAAGRGDVRLPVRRSAAGTARTARCRHCPGEARMSAAKKQAAAADTAPAAITLIEAITQALAYEMRNDESVVVLGEDVGVNGGVFRATAGLSQTFGTQRVLDTPLDETTIAGLTVGMASQGMKPVAEAQFDGFMYPMVDFIVCHAARMRYRTRGRLTCPMVLRVPWGGGIRAPEHHSEANESIFTNVPGLRVVRSEEHTSELQSLMRISYDGFCLKKKKDSNLKMPAIDINKINDELQSNIQQLEERKRKKTVT